MGALRDSFIFVVSPPPIPELGTRHRLLVPPAGPRRQRPRRPAGRAQPDAGHGVAEQDPDRHASGRPGRRAAAELDIDRDKAQALGVTFDAINTAISTSLGSAYVNDFPNAGRLQRVVVQADAPHRMQPDDLLRLNALNTQGQPVPLSAFATTTRWITGPMQTMRYNGYPAMSMTGEPPRATRPARRWTRWSAWRPAAGRLRLRMDRPVARGNPVRLDRVRPDRLLAAGRVPGPGRAV
jgi:multidrug efflux pump